MRPLYFLAIAAIAAAAPAVNAAEPVYPNAADPVESDLSAPTGEATVVEPVEARTDFPMGGYDRDEGVRLGPGEFVWTPEAAPTGLVRIVVSLSKQRLYVYRGSFRIAVSSVSSGKRGYETPTGIFSILQKKVRHHSNLYNNAPMPYMQRLTWDGVALHAGRVPARPASHGCIRLPHAFAQKLFRVTVPGTIVIVEA